MSTVRAEQSAEIAAPPEQVYAVFADYRVAHPAILPSFAFAGLEVEQGGHGAGTVFNAKLRGMGAQRTLRMAVSEPEPGRVLMERDLDGDLVTTFTIAPAADPRRSRVTIATEWPAKSGMAGLFDRWLQPPTLRMVYRKELQLLEQYLAQKNDPQTHTN